MRARGVYFNDLPIIWTRRPTHDGIIVILGRALVVVLVLLFEGIFVVDESNYYYVDDLIKSKAWNDRLMLQKRDARGRGDCPLRQLMLFLVRS